MRGVVGLFEALDRNMGVNLRRDQMRMAEQFLDAAQIRAAIQQVRGVTVAQFVRRQFGVQSRTRQIPLQPRLHYSCRRG